MTNENKKGAGAPADQTIWRWKNTARLTTNFMEVGFAVAAVVIAGTAIYAAAKGVALSSLLPAFLVNPWVIAAIASYVAVYFAARCISAWQETYAMEKVQGTLDKCTLDDVIAKGTLLREENGKTSLQLSDDARKVLLGESKGGILYSVSEKDENTALSYEVKDNGSIAVQLTVGDQSASDFSKIMEIFGADKETNSLDLVLSKLSPTQLINKVATKLSSIKIGALAGEEVKQQG
ncbi:hypothetical protein [Wolbachia endosymbiont of Ctenocephalides felis wCfeJ]|uniref:hypothetical protein n=1 Tax=Wolbachia endosymbiont of Ctenocephalides felis wCfeJ TaxID=2732594 RepID=UPI00144754C7|nr:hypothetical protein [Wolbachia endosymbiont of Ctenocephalides felis wCfeJ]WCR58136.1 MAG: hypothetical protein PG980_000608 [Wolbachia endosymbiont of Ctenocephalides felis wCfeJ]